MSGVHALRALEGPALRSVGEGMAHASARGRDGAREIAWVYGGSEPPQPGDGAFLVDVPFFDGDGLEDIDDIEDVVVALFASVEDMENEDDDMARANALALRAKERAAAEAKVAREGMRLEELEARKEKKRRKEKKKLKELKKRASRREWATSGAGFRV